MYRAGFGPLPLTAEGGTFNAPLKGQRFFGVPDLAENAKLVFSAAGADPAFEQLLYLKNPNNVTGTANQAIIAPNTNSVKMPSLVFATGSFAGSYLLKGATKALDRPVPFFGQVVTTAAGTQGYGFNLLPSVPSGSQTVTTSPKVSGKVELKAN